MVGTRWNEEDPCGRIIRQVEQGLRPGWEVLSFPAIATEADELGRLEGDALWPERYDIEHLEALRNRWDHDEARLGPYWWEALYQQRPAPQEGAVFKRAWFRYFEKDAEFYQLEGGECWAADDCWFLFTADLAISQKESADFFALGVWIVTPNRDLLLYDVVHEHLAGPDQADMIERLSHEYKPMIIAIESVQYQLSLVQELLRRGMPARAVPAKGDKVARSQLAATRFSAGAVYLRRHAPWLTDYEDEMIQFPNGHHDDFVDMTSMAVNELSELVVPVVY